MSCSWPWRAASAGARSLAGQPADSAQVHTAVWPAAAAAARVVWLQGQPVACGGHPGMRRRVWVQVAPGAACGGYGYGTRGWRVGWRAGVIRGVTTVANGWLLVQGKAKVYGWVVRFIGRGLQGVRAEQYAYGMCI